MNATRHKALLLVLGMSGAAALADVGVPRTKIADQSVTHLERMFPKELDDWPVDRSMPIILPAPDVQAKQDAVDKQVLARSYINRKSGARIMLSGAYRGDQSDGMSIHLREDCYPTEEFQVLARSTGLLPIGGSQVPVVRLTTKLGQRFEPVTYWITVRDEVVPTRTEQKIAQIRFGVQTVIPDGMFI